MKLLATVTVLVEGVRFTCNVTGTTTCNDVIIQAVGRENASKFAMFEGCHGVEKLLSPRLRVHKLIRSWGTETVMFSLVVRRSEQRQVIKSKMASIRSASKKLQRMRSILSEGVRVSSSKLKPQRDIYENLRDNVDVKKDYVKDVNVSDVFPVRSPGDGCDSIDMDLNSSIQCDLNEGFVEDFTRESVDLNDGVLYDDETDDVTFEDGALYNDTLSEFERNVIEEDTDLEMTTGTLQRLKEMLSHGHVSACAGDESLESFMTSVLETRDR